MKALTFTFLLLFTTTIAVAQGDVEYRAEIGGGVGFVNYEGDYNGKLLKSPQPMATILARKLFVGAQA